MNIIPFCEVLLGGTSLPPCRLLCFITT